MLIEGAVMLATLFTEFMKCLQVVALGQCGIEVELGKGIAISLSTGDHVITQS